MTLVQEIDAIEKDAAAAIQYAVKRKSEILAMGAGVDQRLKGLGPKVKEVLQRAADSHREFEAWGSITISSSMTPSII